MTSTEPDLPPFPPARILNADFAEKAKLVCQMWAAQIAPASVVVMALYWAKYLVLFIGGWAVWVSFDGNYPGFTSFSTWAFAPQSFMKAVVWALMYESLGFGCSSGPMSARFNPPMGGFLYWLRPGTTKLALFPRLPLVGGLTRTWFDIALYAALELSLLRVLVASEVTPAMLLVPALLVPLNGIADKVLFLAARSEHYWVALVCLTAAFGLGPEPEDLRFVAACQVVWCFIWFWAATSKINHMFPSVIMVMMNNAPFFPAWLKRRLMVEYPTDVRPSKLAAVMAHFGTATEFMIPVLLLTSDGGVQTMIALLVMTSFHGYIGINNPSGMPIEWNIMMIFGGWFLFGAHPDVSVTTVLSMPLLTAFLALFLVAIPAFGNFFPRYVSFLMAMRYYAGNWAYNIWFFRKATDDTPAASDKLSRLTCSSASMRDQLAAMIPDEEMVDLSMDMVMSSRFVHMEGKPLLEALPRVADDLEAYEWWEGEVVAGQALGWNFGDGHLGNENLVNALQPQCEWEAGEVICLMVESQPLFSRKMRWRIVDVAAGLIEEGETDVTALRHEIPYPTGAYADALRRGRGGTAANPA